jgi:hypothetical protein
MDAAVETELLERGLSRFRELLGTNVSVDDFTVGQPQTANLTSPLLDRGADRLVTVRDRQGGTSSPPVYVEAKMKLSPAALSNQVRPQVELLRRSNGDAAVLIISPWLSPRTRQILDELDYGYLDLTGNVSFRLTRPAVVLRLDGDKRDPSPASTQDRRQLRGSKAGRLVRIMADVRPPYTATDLAAATLLSAGYVSRLLDTMEDQAFIGRSRRQITDVDWQGLLRTRAESYALLKANDSASFIAAQGTEALMSRLVDAARTQRLAVTGPFAARVVAPLAVGGQLMVYVETAPKEIGTDAFEDLRQDLGLLRSDSGTDVVLIRAEDPVVFACRRTVDGVPHVSLSQLALDCLSGPGRMPSEGEEVIRYMDTNVDRWRYTDPDRWSRCSELTSTT